MIQWHDKTNIKPEDNQSLFDQEEFQGIKCGVKLEHAKVKYQVVRPGCMGNGLIDFMALGDGVNTGNSKVEFIATIQQRLYNFVESGFC